MRALVVALFVACGPGVSSNAVTSSSANAMAPTPYTSAQIQATNHAGRRLDWAVESAGRREMRTMTFVKTDDSGADVESVTLDETGHAVGEPARSHATWEELREHASFPAAATVVTTESVTVPAGTYACRLYTVTMGPKIMRFWFATTMAGPPVKIVTTESGTITETRELARVIE